MQRILTEKEAEDFLEKEGFNIAKRALVKEKKQLSKLGLNFPWVMKISSRHIIHKAQIGGTLVGIKNLKEAEKAFDKLKALNGFEGILVQEMASGKEIILGLKKTPEFGLVILVGSGGSDVERVKDVSFRVSPITSKDADEMLGELKIKIENSADVKKNLLKLSALASKHPGISELDINPLIVSKNKAVVVDARIAFC